MKLTPAIKVKIDFQIAKDYFNKKKLSGEIEEFKSIR